MDDRIAGLGDRVREAMSGKSVRATALDAKISEGALRSMLNGNGSTLETVFKVADSLGVSASWLATGVGATSDNLDSDSDILQIDLWDIDVDTSISPARYEEVVLKQIPVRRDWLDSMGVPTHNLSAIAARGDAMEPTFFDRDLLLQTDIKHTNAAGETVRGLAPGQQLKADGVYSFFMDGALIVKRVQVDLKGGLHITSDNPRYKDIYLTANELEAVTVVGKVERAWRRV